MYNVLAVLAVWCLSLFHQLVCVVHEDCRRKRNEIVVGYESSWKLAIICMYMTYSNKVNSETNL